MLWFMVYLCAVVMELKATLVMVPAVAYRDHVLVYYRDMYHKNKPAVLMVQRLGDSVTTIRMKTLLLDNSLFVRDYVLVSAVSLPEPNVFSMAIETQLVYLSADRMCEGEYVFVHPDGKPVKYAPNDIAKSSIMWQRRIELPVDYTPGAPDYVHTAVAPDGKKDLLAFDLILTNPEEGKPTPPPKIAVTRIVPEERARTGGFMNAGKPEVKHEENITSTIEEPFQAYVIGADYYFVTKSGEVYISVPAKKGKDRVTVKWTVAMPRVAYVISDGERLGVHFLITARDKAGWHYFRLGPEPKDQLLTDKGPYTNQGPHTEDKEPVEVVRELAELLKAKKLIGAAR